MTVKKLVEFPTENKNKYVFSGKQIETMKTLGNKTLKAYPYLFHLFNDYYYANEWDYELYIRSNSRLEPTDMLKTITDTLKYHGGFDTEQFKMVGVQNSSDITNSGMLYSSGIDTLLSFTDRNNTSEQGDRIYTALIALFDKFEIVAVSPIDKTKFMDERRWIDLIEEHKRENPSKQSIFHTKNVKRHHNHFKTMLENLIETYEPEREKYESKGDKTFPNYCYDGGKLENKEIKIEKLINYFGGGIVFVSIEGYEEESGELEYCRLAQIDIENFEVKHENINLTKIGNEIPFIYVVFEKVTNLVVYMGETTSIETRVKRHTNPTEKDDLKVYQAKSDINCNSWVKGYDFYKKYGEVPATEEWLEVWRSHKVDFNEYEFRFLPLDIFMQQINQKLPKEKQLTSTQTAVMAEAFTMHEVWKELGETGFVMFDDSPNFFNKYIVTPKRPLHWASNVAWHKKEPYDIAGDKTAKSNTSRNNSENSVNATLKSYSEYFSNEYFDFDKEFREQIGFTIIQNINNLSWYEIFKDKALDFEDALRYAAGCFDFKNLLNSYYGLTEIPEQKFKLKKVKEILEMAGYTDFKYTYE